MEKVTKEDLTKVANPIDSMVELANNLIESGMPKVAAEGFVHGAINEMLVHGLTIMKNQIRMAPDKYPKEIHGVPILDYFDSLTINQDRALIQQLLNSEMNLTL